MLPIGCLKDAPNLGCISNAGHDMLSICWWLKSPWNSKYLSELGQTAFFTGCMIFYPKVTSCSDAGQVTPSIGWLNPIPKRSNFKDARILRE